MKHLLFCLFALSCLLSASSAITNRFLYVDQDGNLNSANGICTAEESAAVLKKAEV